MLLFERKQHLQSYDAQSSPFKVNISGERGSDDKRFENV